MTGQYPRRRETAHQAEQRAERIRQRRDAPVLEAGVDRNRIVSKAPALATKIKTRGR